MNFFKSHFSYNKRQRNGILFLLASIVIAQLSYFYLNFIPTPSNLQDPEIAFFQKQIDSIKKRNNSLKPYIIKPFNPNFITDFKGYKLGLSTQQIDKLLAFRKTGSYVNSAKEFQHITGVNDSLLTILSPLFKFPKWVKNTFSKKISKTRNKINKSKLIVKTKDLNKVSANDLQLINGIGKTLSSRIVKYRKLLHGFTYNSQIYEVWHLDTLTANKVIEKFKVLKKPNIEKININTATFKELLHLPYINYELTKHIMNYRRENFPINSLDELKKIKGFPLEKFQRIILYFKAK